MTLAIWPDHEHQRSQHTPVDAITARDRLLDWLHEQARAAGSPQPVLLYPGGRYPEPGRLDGDR